MKWREKRNGEMWYTGPEEGNRVHYARRGGHTFTVQAAYTNPMSRIGPVIWWASTPKDNKAFTTLDAARAMRLECLADAADDALVVGLDYGTNNFSNAEVREREANLRNAMNAARAAGGE